MTALAVQTHLNSSALYLMKTLWNLPSPRFWDKTQNPLMFPWKRRGDIWIDYGRWGVRQSEKRLSTYFNYHSNFPTNLPYHSTSYSHLVYRKLQPPKLLSTLSKGRNHYSLERKLGQRAGQMHAEKKSCRRKREITFAIRRP